MGFGGFPSLAFLDATGKKLGSPAGRDVGIFETTLKALGDWRQLAEKKDRSKAEEVSLFLAELDLGMLSLEDARSRREALDGLSDEQAARADGEILMLEIAAIRQKAGRDAKQANAAYAAMAKDGRTPTGPRSVQFWLGVLTHGLETKDAGLLELGIERSKAEFGTRPGFDRMMQRFVDALAELKKDG
jgi:hypothetical protein